MAIKEKNKLSSDIEFSFACAEKSSFPWADQEVAFVGRSNVGKSTLINSIVGKKICFTSKMPGRTVTINFFAVDVAKRKFIVDLPGYGFSKSPKEMRDKWQALMPDYLQRGNNGSLKMIYVLVDSRIGLGVVDFDMIEMLSANGCNFSVVFTKIDKLKQKEVDELVNFWGAYIDETDARHASFRAEIAEHKHNVNKQNIAPKSVYFVCNKALHIGGGGSIKSLSVDMTNILNPK